MVDLLDFLFFLDRFIDGLNLDTKENRSDQPRENHQIQDRVGRSCAPSLRRCFATGPRIIIRRSLTGPLRLKQRWIQLERRRWTKRLSIFIIETGNSPPRSLFQFIFAGEPDAESTSAKFLFLGGFSPSIAVSCFWVRFSLLRIFLVRFCLCSLTHRIQTEQFSLPCFPFSWLRH